MRTSMQIIVTIMLTGCAINLPLRTDPKIPPGSVLLMDDFSNLTTGWERVQNEGGIMDYDSGGYRILVTAADSNVWSTPDRDFGDVRVEVDAGKFGGPDSNRLGLICRSANSSHYFFVVGSDGYYGLGIFTGGRAALLGQATMQPGESIKHGAAVNHLRLDCNGASLAGFVNGVRVAAVQDATLTHGEVGVLAGTFEQPGADIIFDNFEVLQP